MKIFATIFLAFSIFVQTFSSLIIRVDFYLNRSYIAKNLCVNKDKPMMHCDGKCYLCKKINEQQKQDQQAPVPKNERFDVAPFFVPASFLLECPVAFLKIRHFAGDEGTPASMPHSVFHPPAAGITSLIAA